MHSATVPAVAITSASVDFGNNKMLAIEDTAASNYNTITHPSDGEEAAGGTGPSMCWGV